MPLNTTYRNNGERPANLPADVAAALSTYDARLSKAQNAYQRVRELAPATLDRAAEETDAATAAEAAKKGKPIPVPTAVPHLAADRATADREAAAYAAALDAAAADVDQAISEALAAYYAEEEQRRAKAYRVIKAKAEELAEAITAEAANRADREWLRTRRRDTTPPRVFAWDAMPSLRAYGIAPGNPNARYMLADPGELITRTVAAAFGQEN
ncbi:MAG: hypothetical protein ABS81_07400 [Pseudonocardia sp. SCN 72-86]|nr:MAG: hypothetical protein ABS81_07400 [Pseudonocardia sp. SCN 72-86]